MLLCSVLGTGWSLLLPEVATVLSNGNMFMVLRTSSYVAVFWDVPPCCWVVTGSSWTECSGNRGDLKHQQLSIK